MFGITQGSSSVGNDLTGMFEAKQKPIKIQTHHRRGAYGKTTDDSKDTEEEKRTVTESVNEAKFGSNIVSQYVGINFE